MSLNGALMWSRKNAEERANNRIMPYDMVGTTYSPSRELEGGPSGGAKERETEDGSEEEEHMCIWVRLWNAYHKYYMDLTWWPLRRGGASRWRSDLHDEPPLELLRQCRQPCRYQLLPG